ncbi:MAG: DUF3467 domain-containing protein [Thermoleophilaceae bacterium]|nr:DUF3467 domain-containing protein [Thermoleophilaceae bacterium]
MTPLERPNPDEDVPRVYVNAVNLQGGLYDVTLDLAHRVGNEDVAWTMRVTMSWEHARALADALSEATTEYQADIGEVRDVERAAARLLGEEG